MLCCHIQSSGAIFDRVCSNHSELMLRCKHTSYILPIKVALNAMFLLLPPVSDNLSLQRQTSVVHPGTMFWDVTCYLCSRGRTREDGYLCYTELRGSTQNTWLSFLPDWKLKNGLCLLISKLYQQDEAFTAGGQRQVEVSYTLTLHRADHRLISDHLMITITIFFFALKRAFLGETCMNAPYHQLA